MPAWRVYFGDESTYCDQDGPVELVPGRSVQAINERLRDGRVVMLKGSDYYWWSHPDARWYQGDLGGVFDMLGLPGWAKVIQGRSIPDDAYGRILQVAGTDPDFYGP